MLHACVLPPHSVIAMFSFYLLCHLSHPVGGAVAEVWPFGAPGPRHSAEERGDACNTREQTQQLEGGQFSPVSHAMQQTNCLTGTKISKRPAKLLLEHKCRRDTKRFLHG